MPGIPAGLRDFATRYTAAWCSQDAARVAAHFSSNGSLSVNESTPAIGRNAIQGVAQSFMTAFPDLQVILDRLEIKSDYAEYPLDACRYECRSGGQRQARANQWHGTMEVWERRIGRVVRRSVRRRRL
jgi:hypothetical protein